MTMMVHDQCCMAYSFVCLQKRQPNADRFITKTDLKQAHLSVHPTTSYSFTTLLHETDQTLSHDLRNRRHSKVINVTAQASYFLTLHSITTGLQS